MTLRITNGFGKMADPQLLARTNSIVTALSENFATAPLLPALISARDNFSVALAAAAEGGTVAKAEKDEAKEALIDQLHLMSYYVLLTCAGDRTMAIKSGYTVSKEPTPTAPLQPADNQATADGQNGGELLFSFKPVAAARSYVYQYTADPLTAGSVWVEKVGTKSKYLFTGLETGKRYWMRVASIGTNNQMVYSNPILSRMVQ